MESTQSSLKTKTLVLKVRLAINAACIVNQKADKFICLLLPPTKEEVNAFACVCLSVCLSVSKIIQKRVHGFGWNVACRQMSGHGRTDYLLNPIRIIVRMPEPDWFLRYRISAVTRNFTSGKSDVYVLATAARRGFKMVLFTEAVSRRNTFVGGTCAPPSALLVIFCIYALYLFVCLLAWLVFIFVSLSVCLPGSA